jgi:beta-mannosidase
VTGGVDLGGAWRARLATDELSKRFAADDVDDADWAEITVPGHWRSHPDFAAADGPLLYRRGFGQDPPPPGRRAFLELDGVFYFADVWLDGEYVGATDGYFVHHRFEVTDLLRAERPHTLGVEVACPAQTDRTGKRIVTGVFSHSEYLDPTTNPGGIWRPVRITESGPARLTGCRVRCIEASETRGRLAVDATIDVPTAVTARALVEVEGPSGALLANLQEDVALAAGVNRRTFEIMIENPPRWWPWRLGDQPLCDVDVAIEVGGDPSDRRRLRTALREVRVDDWIFTVNGQRLYVMGTALGPTRPGLADATLDEIEGDLRLARDANLDLVRVHAHVARPELYDAADRLGLLLWQDFPLLWGYSRGIRKQAVRQARAMVDQLGHHPSIALWAAHDEPFPVDTAAGEWPGGRSAFGRARVRLTQFTGMPTWTKDVLDRSIARAIRRTDGTRLVVRGSGVLPGLDSTGTDAHLSIGWHTARARDLAVLLAQWPRLARFVTEHGAQSVPANAAFMEPERWPDLDWDALAEHHGLQRAEVEEHVPPARYPTFDAWRAATQAYQAALVQLHVEDLRRLRFSPGGGFCQLRLADPQPAIAATLADHARTPKPAYRALRDACRPVLPMLDPRTGRVHVVNEGRSPVRDAVLEVTLPGARWRFGGSVGADGVTHVGVVDLGGARTARVVLASAGVDPVTNEYPEAVFALVLANSEGFRGRE